MNPYHETIDLVSSLCDGELRLVAIELAKRMPSTFIRFARSIKNEKEPVDRSSSGVTSDLSLEDETINLLKSMGKIAAIKNYRIKTGAGLVEAKEAVDRLMDAHNLLENETINLLKNMGKIAAIKNYRVKTGAGLVEAKEAVERLMDAHNL